MEFNKEEFKKNLSARLRRQYGKDISQANKHDLFDAVSASAFELIMPNWMATRAEYEKKPTKQLYYLSAEFLMGRALSNNLINAGIKDAVKEVLKDMNIDYDMVEDEEPDAGLGNGGLGRLAACFLDSLATLDYPGHGYGIRYEYGMFEQRIEDGYQVEYPDNWLVHRDPWEIKRSDLAVTVKFGGNIAYGKTPDGKPRFYLENAEEVTATPYDMPIIGYDTKTVNTLRLWQASSPNGFDLQLFNNMDYNRAVERQNSAENISRVLYPNDNGPSGKALRLKQQYFFVSASIQRALARFKRSHDDLHDLPKKVTFQMNDTHPTVAVAELMRILVDEEKLSWDDAWDITTHCVAYTNHTIMAEALEKWPIDIFQRLLPRVYQIVDEINRRFVNDILARYPGNDEKVRKMAILYDGQVKMAHLAMAAGYSINGVAKLHTEILMKQELKDFYEMFPEKFNNKTNGITQRRFLAHGNPLLADWVTKKVGKEWITDLPRLENLTKYADDKSAQKEFREIKYQNKVRLAKYIKEHNGIDVDPNSIFDVQVKRLHEYKRQLMNILHIMYLYNQLKDNPNMEFYPTTFIFGAKAAAGYRTAKSTIKLINSVADVINNDASINGKIKVVFIEDYKVSTAEMIFAAADVSEQISTASKEASGTGNMKFMLNGAITIGTMDGANVEMFDEVGADNIFIFGMSSDEVIAHEQKRDYHPMDLYNNDWDIRRVLNQLVDGTYSPNDHELFRELYNSLLNPKQGEIADRYFILADFRSYADAQRKLNSFYQYRDEWTHSAILNVAHVGKFSSDRTIEQYAQEIWHLDKIKVNTTGV